MSSSAIMFSQLKSFCYSIEQDAKKLRAVAEQKSNNGAVVPDCRSGLEYVAELKTDIEKADRDLEKMFNDVCGTPEKRLAFITMEEMLMKCRALFEVNENMILSLETHLEKFGFKGDTKRGDRNKILRSGKYGLICNYIL